MPRPERRQSKGTPDPDSQDTRVRVEAAKSGDMAYVSGTYETTAKDASGSTTKDRGKYLEVWEKQADRSWKCGADMFSSDLPAVADKKCYNSAEDSARESHESREKI